MGYVIHRYIDVAKYILLIGVHCLCSLTVLHISEAILVTFRCVRVLNATSSHQRPLPFGIFGGHVRVFSLREQRITSFRRRTVVGPSRVLNNYLNSRNPSLNPIAKWSLLWKKKEEKFFIGTPNWSRCEHEVSVYVAWFDTLQIKRTVRDVRGLCVWNIYERVGKEIRQCFGKSFVLTIF